MALPKIDLPIYELKLPSTGEKVKFRPFTVKEEKILLIAQESKDPAQVMSATTQIVNNCLVDCDVNNLALFDLEYILITLRSKSIDNKVDFEIDDPETNEKIKLTLDLTNVKVIKNEEHTNKIKINDTYTLFLKYPGIEKFDTMSKENMTAEDTFDILISCIDKLASEDEVYKIKDFSKKEIDDFIESLNSDVTRQIKKFFDTMPKIRHEMPYVNKEGKEKTFVIEGTQTFFI